MSYLKNQLYQNLIKLGVEPEKNNFTLAISGGADSTALFFVFLEIKNETGLNFNICHLHHGIRKESDIELEYIRKLSAKYNIPLFYKKIDVLKIKYSSKKSIEMIAREKRYEFFKEAKDYFNSDYIVMAHHLDDVVETFVLRLIKGMGLQGAISINPKRQFYLRPFFNITKQQILNYLNKNNIKYFEDKTNYDIKYERNYIRNIVLKEFEKFFKGYRSSIFDFIELLRENEEFIDRVIDKELINSNRLDIKCLLKKDSYIIKRVIEKKIRKVNNRNVTKNNIDTVLNGIKNEDNKNKTILETKKFVIYRYKNFIYFLNEKFIKVKKRVKSIKKTLIDFEKNEFFCYIITKTNIELLEENNKNNYLKSLSDCFYIDKDKITGNLYVDFRKDGDRIYLNPGIEKKIKKIFNENDIPFFLRDFIPIIRDDKNLIGIILIDFFDKNFNISLNKIDNKNKNKKMKYILNSHYYINKKTKNVVKIEVDFKDIFECNI